MNEIFARLNRAVLVQNRWQLYLQGLGNTLVIAFMAAVIGTILGIVFSTINYIYLKTGKLKILSKISNIYITVVRGTPVVLQLMILYYVVFVAWDNGIMIGAITFGLNSGAYMAEIIRSGYNSIDDGQMEAGRGIGLSLPETMWHIIIPQTAKNSLPSLFNEFISLIKETSIVGYVGIYDLGKIPGLIQSRTFDYLFPLLISSMLYLAVVLLLTKVLRTLEAKFSVSDRRILHKYNNQNG